MHTLVAIVAALFLVAALPGPEADPGATISRARMEALILKLPLDGSTR